MPPMHYMTSGLAHGDLPNPVEVAPRTRITPDLPAIETGAPAFGAERPGAGAGVLNVLRRDLLSLGYGGAPANPEAAPDRAAHHPQGPAWTMREWSDEWRQTGAGAHGVITPGAGSPPGAMLPFLSRRNSFRLPPEPWDSPLYEAFNVPPDDGA